MHVEVLEDLRTLVTSRVHSCADAQAGLGTGIPGAGSRNIGTATTVAHRAEKQRLLECFNMEHLLTATNTFSDDDRKRQHLHVQQQRMPRSRTFDSSATASDHWVLTATIRAKRDHIGSNNTVRAQLNVGSDPFGQELWLSDNPSCALYIYTDGSARDVSRRQKCAWVELHGSTR